MPYVYLLVAIAAEMFATTILKDTNGFTVVIPTLKVLLGYGVAFYMLSLCVQTLPTGVIYAIWSGVGIVGIAILAYFVHHQALDLPAILGILLIVTGVLVIKIFSKTAV